MTKAGAGEEAAEEGAVVEEAAEEEAAEEEDAEGADVAEDTSLYRLVHPTSSDVARRDYY